MPQLVLSPTRIPVSGGKTIDEHVGRVTTGTEHVSIAHMVAPAGWTEPAQTPAFEELTLVLRGTLLVEHDGGMLEARAGQSVITFPGERVRYSTGPEAGAEYVAVCLPAFAPELAHRHED
jgi:ethanolamine utilization protein EutQ (cupin superfamily)